MNFFISSYDYYFSTHKFSVVFFLIIFIFLLKLLRSNYLLNCVSHKKLLKFCLWLGKFIVLYFYFTEKSIWKAIFHYFCLGFHYFFDFKQPHTLLVVFNLFNKANLSLLYLDTNITRVGLVYGILVGELAYLMHFLFIDSNVRNSTRPINMKHHLHTWSVQLWTYATPPTCKS